MMNPTKSLFLSAAFVAAGFASAVVSPASETFLPPQPPKNFAPLRLPPNVDRDVVRLRLLVDKSGRARKITVVSLCDQVVAMRLIPAVEKWQFTPAMENGHAVEAEVILPLRLVDLAGGDSRRL